jgi:hypothetical protein
MNALAAYLTRFATAEYARSALPDAPVLPDDPPARRKWRRLSRR